MLWHFSLVTLPHAVASLLIFAMSTTISVILASFGLLDRVHENVWKPWHNLFYRNLPSIFNPAAIAVITLAGIIAAVGGYAVWWYQSYHRQSFRTEHDRRVARKAKNAVEAVRSTAMNIVDAVSPRRLLAYEQQLENKLGLHRKGSKSRRQKHENEDEESPETSGTEYENESEIVARRGINSSQQRSSSKSKDKKSRGGSKGSSKQRSSKQGGGRERSASPTKKAGRAKGRTARASTMTSKPSSGKSRSPSKSPVRRLQSL